GKAFRMYVEATQGLGAVGTYSTGFALENIGIGGGTVTFELYTAAGVQAASPVTLPVAGSGHIAKFLAEIFPSLSLPFLGVLRISTSTLGISVTGLRIRYNERGDVLITTTPPASETAPMPPGEFDFPQVVNGGGFTTQFILFSGTPGVSSTGSLQFVKA